MASSSAARRLADERAGRIAERRERVRELRAAGTTLADIAAEVGVSVPTVTRDMHALGPVALSRVQPEVPSGLDAQLQALSDPASDLDSAERRSQIADAMASTLLLLIRARVKRALTQDRAARTMIALVHELSHVAGLARLAQLRVEQAVEDEAAGEPPRAILRYAEIFPGETGQARAPRSEQPPLTDEEMEGLDWHDVYADPKAGATR